ncbi:hypothetical protein [Marinomonas shanghaiensis]|uniref:hypothetical protein n=1 Tax=Marinomonas shanghaiensis TaxID=2202418 RepID=UPI003A92BD5D
MLCPSKVTSSPISHFWSDLAAGKAKKAPYYANTKTAQIFGRSTYFPVEVEGKVIKVIKIATNVTQNKMAADSQNSIFSNRSILYDNRIFSMAQLYRQQQFHNTMGYNR